MRTLKEYWQLANQKYQEDSEITGISYEECVDFIVRNAYIDDEIEESNVKLLKQRLLTFNP